MSVLALPFRHLRTARRRRASAGILHVVANVDPRRWNVVVLTLLAALTVGYLALTNGNATAGYELRTLERRVDTLRQETRRLELRSLSSQSIDVLTSRIAELGYVPVAHVEYLTPLTGVAQR
ncbi:MAG: hypothetical protein Q7S02_04710 [bacterium]|nr:hypothetical protein [bacterium]